MDCMLILGLEPSSLNASQTKYSKIIRCDIGIMRKKKEKGDNVINTQNYNFK